MNVLQFLRLLIKGPTAQQMAAQLRRPSGLLARKVAERMNSANRLLYDGTWDTLHLRDGMNVLEIGFGNGSFFPELASRAKGLKIHGLDFSEAIVKEARERNGALIKAGTLDLHHCSSDRMPFVDGLFERVYCINVIYFWEDPASHLREVLRVLKPGGEFMATLRTKATMEQLPFTRFGFTMYEEGDWKAVLHANGFEHLRTVHLEEPAVEYDGGRYKPQSLVMVATKA